MKKIPITIFILIFLSACTSNVKIDQDKLSQVKKVAVVIFTLKKSIEYRDEPNKDDSDILALHANSLAAGDGENAATLALPSFINQLNTYKLPFKVMSLAQMKNNKKFMSLYQKPEDKGLLGTLGSFFSSGLDGASARGFMNFGLPEKFNENNGKALMGKDHEIKYIRAAMQALNVDAALIVVDRGTSFQCNALCLSGTGQASMGGAFHSLLINRRGDEVVRVNQWFEGNANALMTVYAVNPLERDGLYSAHGKQMADEYYKAFINQGK